MPRDQRYSQQRGNQRSSSRPSSRAGSRGSHVGGQRSGRSASFNAKQSRRTSCHVSDNMVGTHVRPSVQAGGRKMNASSVSFSSSRKRNRAVRGEVQALVPNTGSREGKRAYNQRVNQRQYAKQIQHRSRMRSIALLAVGVLLIVGLAVGAGVFTYNNTVGGNTGLGKSDAKSALTATKDNKPFYTLISVELGSTSATLDNNGPDVIFLMRVDASSKAVTFVPIPANLQVTYESETMQLADVQQKGDAAFINAVKTFADVDIAHYFKLEESDLVKLVDQLGGVDLSLSQEIDDPNAGDIYIPAGDQTLNGQQSVVFQRATNVSGGLDGQLQNQVKFASALLSKLFDTGSLSFANVLSDIAPYFKTDMSSNDIIFLVGSLSDMKASDFTTVSVPGYEKTQSSIASGSTTYFISSTSSWKTIMSDLDEGNTEAGTSTIEAVDPASFTIEVRNGASITGAATATTEKLAKLGFKVEKSGNADQQIYEQTLVIYDKDNGLERAQTVINALGVGRAVKGQGYYEYDTDVLVILGGDYKPSK